ncbi:hypothetical protein STEG23_016866 [Scotinomys teguina]
MAAAAAAAAATEQTSSNGPVKKSMREKAVERRTVNKEHNSNFKAGYIPIDEDRLHKTGLRGRKGNLAICVIVLLFILAVINLLITLVIWAVIRIGPNGCDSMEFHESGLLRFKQVSDMGVIHPLYKSTVGGRRNENLVITGNNQPIVFQQGTTKLSVEKNRTSITSDIGMQFFDPRTQNILFSTDYETHEFHLPSGVKSLNVQKASTERITSNATSDLNIKVDGRAIVRGNEGVFIMGKTIEFHMGGNVELKAENSIILNGTVMVSPTRLPSSSSGDQSGSSDWDKGLKSYVSIMRDFYFGVTVTVIVIGLRFPETATTPPRKSSIFHNSEYRCDGHLLTNYSSTRHTSQIAGIRDVRSLFSRVLFQSRTRKDWQTKRLDLSNHSLSKMTLSPLAPLHALEMLNLSNNAMHSLWLDLPGPCPEQPRHHSSRSPCSLPRLKVLILQRNQLRGTPKGLWKLTSLQSLDLSFNRIVHIGLADFHSCLHLESIYLKSNELRTIHPGAFKDLKKLQVVDLRSNALTTLAPLVTIALESPHLELDLADNQWQCGESSATFQNVTSASWREKWNAICNMSVGNEKSHLETPQIRISRNTHLLPTPRDVESLMQSKAERPQEGVDIHLSALERDAQADYDDLKEIWPQPPTELGDSKDGHVTDRKDEDPPDLALPICLSVFSTFVVAFCLGAFARPYIDRLWRQRCLNKRPGPEDAYSNEGFYDDIEAPRRVQHQERELHQAFHHQNLYESRNPSWVTEPSPDGAVMSERVRENSKMDPCSQQSPVQLEDNTGAGNGDCNVLPHGHTAHSALRGLPNADTHELISAVQDHNNVPEELHYDTVAQEYSLYEGVMDRSSTASPLGTVPGSIHGGCDELCQSQSRDVVAPDSKTLVPMNTQGSGESKERGCPEPLGEFSEERQVSDSIRGLATQQPGFQGVNAEEKLSDVYDEVPHNEPKDVDLPSLMPRWGSGPHVTPTTEEPLDPLYDLVANYESDSEEGSLFTLSSESSEDTRSLAEEQVSMEKGGAGQPLPSRSSGEYKTNGTSAESDEDITSQRILEKCEIREALFENPLFSSPDSFV